MRGMAPRRLGYLLAAALVFVTLYAFPYFTRVYNANELPRIDLVRAILDRGTFSIGDERHPPSSITDTALFEGRYYSNKAPGLSFAGVPVLWAQRQIHAVLGVAPPSERAVTYVLRLFCVTLPSLLFLIVVWRTTGLFTDDPRARAVTVAGYALGSLALPVSLLYMSHQTAAAMVGTSFILLVGAVKRWEVIVAGLLAGGAVLFDYQSAFFLVPVAIYALATVRPWPRLVMCALASLPPVAALLVYHHVCFGSIAATGYNFAAVAEFRAIHGTGFLGLSAPSATSFFQSFLAPDNGMFVLAPWLLLGIAGWVLVWRARRARPEIAVSAAIGIIAVIFLTCLLFARGGWQMGPRYIAIAVPFFAAPAAAALAALGPRLRAVATGLVLGAVLLHVAGALLFPHWPDKLRNPVVELVWPLLRDGFAPYCLALGVGLPARIALWPPLLVAAAAVLGSARLTWRATVVAVLVAALFLAHFALYPRTAAPERARIYAWVTSIWEP